jgi:nucleotide-binding universal stress UspA family protein
MNGPGGDGTARIVVGVDGSDGSKAALRWAARQAGLTGAALEAVITWEYPTFYGWAPAYPDDLDLASLAEQTLADALDEVFGSDRPAWLRSRVLEGHPGQVLIEASAGAELLVVGSRGYGGFADALLGSVSTYCLHHGRGPITIIRPAVSGPRTEDPTR